MNASNVPTSYADILSSMQDSYQSLTGFEADSASDIGIRLRVLAEQMANLFARIGALDEQVFPQTSTGLHLDHHAECRGLLRKEATQAQGMLRFARETPAPSDIPIGAGVICTTRPNPQVQFVTSEDAVLPAGETSVDIPARAVEAGAGGNIPADAVCLMVSAAPGVTAVHNPAPFQGGVDAEDDESLRSRLLDAYRNISNGTNAAFYYDIAMQHKSVTSAVVLPRNRGRGTVDVYFSSATAQEAIAALNELEDEFSLRREINVDVLVQIAQEKAALVVAGIEAEEGRNHDEVAEACRLAILEHINGLGVGKPLLLSRLIRRLLEVDGIYNVVIDSPEEDIVPPSTQILVPHRNCRVERMGDL